MKTLPKIFTGFIAAVLSIALYAAESTGVATLANSLVKTAFETEAEYQVRIKPLVDNFNQAATQQTPEYAAGSVILDDKQYNADTEVFLLKVQWTDWAMPIAVIEEGLIKIPRDEAKALFESSAKQPLPVFMSITAGQIEPLPDNFILASGGKTWEILLSGGAGTPAELLAPKKDAFDSEAQFQARRERLLAYYNEAVNQRELTFQAGKVKFNKENYINEVLFFDIAWEAWVNDSFQLSSTGYFIRIPRTKAVRLPYDDVPLPIFIKGDYKNQAINSEIFLSSDIVIFL